MRFTKKWFAAAGIRALKTFCQTAVSMITVGQALLEIHWVHIVSVSAVAAIVSILTSLAGLPELEEAEEAEEAEGENE